jgi:ubiquitin-like 1-activating enzyme E1 A
MSNARVLYVNLTGVSCEIMKNLVLAGVACTVCDDRPYPDAVREMPCSFFRAVDMEAAATASSNNNDDEPKTKKAKTTPTTVASAIQPKVEELNPLLSGRNSIEERPLASLPDDYFTQFDAIVSSRLTVSEVKRISSSLQKAEESKLFIVTDTFGFDGCAHLDFGSSHTYRRELGKDKLSDLMNVKPHISMVDMLDVPLADVKGRWDKVVPSTLVVHRLLMDYWGESKSNDGQKHDFVNFASGWLSSNNLPTDSVSMDLSQLADIANHPEVSPVCAVLGGLLGNEVIKALTGKGEPANNVMLFNGINGGCRSFLVTAGEKK